MDDHHHDGHDQVQCHQHEDGESLGIHSVSTRLQLSLHPVRVGKVHHQEEHEREEHEHDGDREQEPGEDGVGAVLGLEVAGGVHKQSNVGNHHQHCYY